VLDYGRTYGLKTVVLRQSCIYGERQFGMLGQGWISWFARKILEGEAVTIYGDGKQVRDILYVDDWVNVAWQAAQIGEGVYNIGGGPANTISVLEAIDHLEKMTGITVKKHFDQPRVSDQEYYVSDITKAKNKLHWEPKVGIDEGLKRLIDWTKKII
jgi:CDP-paratose 2-epimerase